MKDEDFKQLEILLARLRTHIGHDFAIVPGVVQDGYNIAIYDKSGDLIDSKSSHDIKSTIHKLNI